LEVFFHGRIDPHYFLLEMATFPEKRVYEQALSDLSLAYHQLQVLPELLTVVLHPKGRLRIQGAHEVTSRLQWSRLACQWKVVELWELAAEDLLSAQQVGLLPWVALTRFQGPPGPILEQCRRQIDAQALPDERANLLAVSQVLAQLRYNDPKLLAILGGKQLMDESPLIQEIVAEKKQEARQEDIQDVLQARFGSVPKDIVERLPGVRSEKKLRALVKYAGRCSDLESFRARLFS
jgi:predicted transposase YdaD